MLVAPLVDDALVLPKATNAPFLAKWTLRGWSPICRLFSSPPIMFNKDQTLFWKKKIPTLPLLVSPPKLAVGAETAKTFPFLDKETAVPNSSPALPTKLPPRTLHWLLRYSYTSTKPASEPPVSSNGALNAKTFPLPDNEMEIPKSSAEVPDMVAPSCAHPPLFS